jgi:nucleotide-binding universal stress UspA family protein
VCLAGGSNPTGLGLLLLLGSEWHSEGADGLRRGSESGCAERLSCLPQLPCSALGASCDTILVGVDGTERSRDALALAELLAGAAGGRLLIVHVHNYGQLEGLVSGGEYETLVRQVAESTAAAVRDLLGDQRAHDVRLVAARSPAAGLQDFARREAASLIVVGSSHRSSVGSVQPGGVGQRLLAGAPIPVALAPLGYAGHARRLDTVGCGFDGLDESRQALEWAAALARRAGAALRVVAVHEPMAFSNVPTGALGGGSANEALRRTLRSRLDEAVAQVGSDVPTEAVFGEGGAVQVLDRAAEELDLLVVGSRGYGPLRVVLLGSVSGQLIATATAPIVVVPRGASAGAPSGEPDQQPSH